MSNQPFQGPERRVAPYCNYDEELMKEVIALRAQQAQQSLLQQNNYNPMKMNNNNNKPEFGIWLQIITIIGSAAVSGFGIYMSLHDEQLALKLKVDNFLEKYGEADLRHLKLHEELQHQVDRLIAKYDSLESSVDQIMSSARRIR
jgi:hypothetical protein